ncbi:MAG: hypothetical protein J0L61_03250, partial [Planctomycetes bacterium]|nr:hypothetical protein [Planctomycetota bacterium]
AYPAPPGANTLPRETISVPDRWRIGWPRWDRYNRAAPSDSILMNQSGGDGPYNLGHPLNPYDRNVLKGDYPIFGDDYFVNLTFVSDTFVKHGKLPVPSGNSTADAGAFEAFGFGQFTAVNQTFLTTFELFKGYAAFRPVDWRLNVTGAYNVNWLQLDENNAVNINPRRDDERTDKHFALQTAFFEYHLGDVSPRFDIAAVQFGRQLFSSDFRGFIYNDVADGVRLFGNYDSNRIQYNLAFFNQVEKDTNSGLNELDWRDQQVLIANLYVQDFIWKGYTAQWSFHWNNENSDERYDDNGFPVRPDLFGTAEPHSIDAYYLGWAGDGHIDRLNLTHAFYYVLGKDSSNPLAGRSTDISAFMGAVELSVDFDWLRPKASFMYASGDSDPTDDTAGGFDAIIDNPVFAGGPSSFYQSNPLGLAGVRLTNPGTFFNHLRSSKSEGQSNFVNPGTILVNTGVDAEITPKLRASLNANWIWFADTDTVEYALNQNGVDAYVGREVNLTFQYRPWLNNNIILTAGGSLFFPAEGFDDIYDNEETLYQVFAGVTLTY